MIPDWLLAALTRLTSFKMAEDRKRAVDFPTMERFTQLRALTLSNQNIQHCVLPLSLQTLVCQNAFVTLPRCVLVLTNLVQLDCSRNTTVSFREVFTLTQLR